MKLSIAGSVAILSKNWLGPNYMQQNILGVKLDESNLLLFH